MSIYPLMLQPRWEIWSATTAGRRPRSPATHPDGMQRPLNPRPDDHSRSTAPRRRTSGPRQVGDTVLVCYRHDVDKNAGVGLMFLAVRELRFAKVRFGLMGAVVALIAVLMVMLSGLSVGLVRDGVSGLQKLPVTSFALERGVQHDSAFSRSV